MPQGADEAAVDADLRQVSDLREIEQQRRAGLVAGGRRKRLAVSGDTREITDTGVHLFVKRGQRGQARGLLRTAFRLERHFPGAVETRSQSRHRMSDGPETPLGFILSPSFLNGRSRMLDLPRRVLRKAVTAGGILVGPVGVQSPARTCRRSTFPRNSSSNVAFSSGRSTWRPA